MAESLSSAELLRQLKSLGMERLVHVVNAFLRQSYTYPPLLTFGGKTPFVYLADVQGTEARCLLRSPSSQAAATRPRRWAPGPLSGAGGARLRSGPRSSPPGAEQHLVQLMLLCVLSRKRVPGYRSFTW